MAFTDDDEEEVLPDVVSDYYFYDAEDQPISFAELPVQWSNGERSHDNDIMIYLRGTTDNGLQRLHKQVMAWKYEFSKENPEISVLSKVNNWIKLQKPRKSFESIIRTILITVQCLHFFNRKPNESSKDLRDHLCKVFRFIFLF
ncbi:putative DNA (cytosine-5)-methyltransferase 1, replication foci domain-containing protein [Helianthus annuus]|uniref:DNA (Cytosine-5)-methyltransferase 1, replication foci domain-containing protein n=1 Tax=Helianthus annuus TaxID=4232 RepID=A0A251TAH9_HELAN|nr:putative DNA (cytosine-5)-methyltransferase 1, replication foci domain-containing protein [Helianthus annuus]KAJ0508526.1 putative DNA (cytosine-5)-methyltransferase 1, replication foci domain-containing protein [Helianthus annuus]KAJ0516775.1 putative DNA (cytosine-5)-methyltransferase 1, replication foci domain-containing protein [Helianthus annuus]KAJ0684777.1 putative DNA (cytosine-5)-methyltransferase 1, replication foci domain-containing protein [Helianthus annuus]